MTIFLAKALTLLIFLQVLLLCSCSVNIGINDMSGTCDISQQKEPVIENPSDVVTNDLIQFRRAE